MLSVASAAFQADGTLVDTFTANLDTLPDAQGHPDTMAWWETQPAAWQACRAELQAPSQAMKAYVAWLKGLSGKPVFVAYPAGFDFTFVYWYLIQFAGESPFSFSALDIKTLAMTALSKDYRQATKRNMPKRWFGESKHTHIALDDAIEQGELFCNILAEIRSKR